MNLDEFYQKMEEHWKKSDRDSKIVIWGCLGFLAVWLLVYSFFTF
ncbi:Uncharacterised protein [uncultured Clostridium sp.]|nr:hypothetical protein [Intestinimonas butyriciproducens]SCI67147.1 Uncharacterised protein [uncultured Clostridium sp.]